METAKQLASHALVSADEHARMATTLRRVAGGLHTAVQQHELTPKERSILADAAQLLEALAKSRKEASVLRTRIESARATLEREVQSAMSTNFACLEDAADKVAFIAAIEPYRRGLTRPVDSLRVPKDVDHLLSQEFKECLTSAAYTLADTALKKGGTAAAVVEDAWATFQSAKAELQTQYAPVLERIDGLRRTRAL